MSDPPENCGSGVKGKIDSGREVSMALRIDLSVGVCSMAMPFAAAAAVAAA
jgi:hypothetical protein